jgi:hypothetical protein
MLAPMQRSRWLLLLLILGLSTPLLVQCVATAVSASHIPGPAGLCEPRCPPATTPAPGPVALPTPGGLLLWQPPCRGWAHEHYQPILPLMVAGVSLIRAPPPLASCRISHS